MSESASGVRRRSAAALAAGMLLLGLAVPRVVSAIEDGVRQPARAAIARGSAYLVAQQKGDGSWEDHVGFTAIAVLALLPGSGNARLGDGPIARGLAYLERWVRPDGGIYQDDIPHYTTAVSMLAFAASGDPRYKERIAAAREFLVGRQASEDNGFPESSVNYGGTLIGGGKTNLDATFFTLRALAEAGLPRQHPYWARALRFVTRCQNWKATNDQPWAGTDGGFIFSPGFSFAGGTASYGTMTYAGLSAYRALGLSRGDERVAAALRWLGANFTVHDNPGLGKQTLYHSYLYMAETLTAWGVDTLVDGAGKPRSWRPELAEALIALQGPDGSWANSEDSRWYESKPLLATSFAVRALNHVVGAPRP